MKKALFVVIGGVVILLVVLIVRTAAYDSRQVAVTPVPDIAVDLDAATQRLAGALTFRTISYQDSTKFDHEEFARFHAYLDAQFPLVRARVTKETVGGYSLLYSWSGSDPTLKPIILMAHMDAVPVELGTENDWTHDPFDGEIADGYVWGRGAMDDKGSLIAILEAVETLLREGFEPRRTIYLAFGHDEEVFGRRGAAAIARQLADQQIEPEFVLDEGGAVADGLIPGVRRPVALVGIAEKGYLTLELTVRTTSGHSSMPPAETAIGILSEAIHKLRQRPVPGGVRGATAIMFEYLAPELPFVPRLFLANRWLFGWLIERQFGASPEGNAMLRTTRAPTIIEAGVKENVLPSAARAVVNFRILPGDSSGSIIEHARRTINDALVDIEPIGFVTEPSPVSDVKSRSFQLLQRTIQEVYPTALVIPWLVVGGTDARHYTRLTRSVYRFGAGRVGPDDLNRLHGTDERVAIEAYGDMVKFYVQLLRNSAT